MSDYWPGGVLYKHINNTDVAIAILKQFYVKEKDTWKLKVMWWNVSTKRPPYCTYIEQRIEIPNKNKKDWRIYEHDS